MIALSWREFDLLAAGRSDRASMSVLRAGQLSKHLLLLRQVLVEARANFPGEIEAGFDLLSKVQTEAPDEFTKALSDPHFGAWATHVLRRMCAEDLAHLGTIATGGLRMRVLSAHGFSACLDDVNPYRDLHGLGASDHLTDQEAREWEALFAEAWELLAERRDEVASCLVSLVPLAPRDLAKGASATSRDAYGAVALTKPESALSFAVTLVHECQHSKLDALLDLVELYDPADECRYYSPWRADPRPLGGLLQGTYAFLGVADFWRTRRTELAEFEFARTTEQLRRALDTLDGAALTEHGRRFTAGMRATLDGWPVVSGPNAAREAVDDHWTIWRLRNLTVAVPTARELAAAWLSGQRCDIEAPEVLAPRVDLDQLDLAQLRLVDRLRLGAGEQVPGYSALAAGDHAAAGRVFLDRLTADPDDLESWAGLAVARRRQSPIWAARPELVYAVHRGIRELCDTVPSPDELVRWLGPVSWIHVRDSRA